MFHGTRKIIFQISFQLQLQQVIPFKLRELSKSETPDTQEYLKKIIDSKRSNMTKIFDHCYAIGKITSYILTPEQVNIVSTTSSLTITDTTVQSFERLMLHNVVYHCKNYTRTTSRNNTMCSYIRSNNSTGLGCIQSFHISPQCGPFYFIKMYDNSSLSPVSELRPSRNMCI